MSDHWLLRGLDVKTVVIITAAGTALYFGLVREIDRLTDGQADIEHDVGEINRRLTSIERHVRRATAPAYSWEDMTPARRSYGSDRRIR